MGDLKEDLLDTAAVLKEKFKNLSPFNWVLLLFSFVAWPLFYILLAFGFIKLFISGVGSIYLMSLCYKKD